VRQEKNNIFANIDWLLVLLFILLVAFGWVNIYAASITLEDKSLFDFTTKYGKQLLWIMLCFPLIIIILFFNSKFYERYASLFYIISLFTLLLLFPLGKEINGAKSWFNFGAMSLQPSEFVKAFTALAIAKLLSDRKYNFKLIKNQIKAFIIVFFPAFIIVLQPDAGSALIYVSFFFVLHREGLTLAYIIFGALSIVLFIATIIAGVKVIISSLYILITIYIIYCIYRDKRFLKFNWMKVVGLYLFSSFFILSADYSYNNILKKHQRDRFEVILGKTSDTKQIGYNSDQSIQTISSGKFWGKGFLEGDKTQGNFVPAQDTDYIFSVVGEEWGFVGSSLVIFLFMALLYRIIYRAEKHANKFGRIYGYGVASILFFHLIVNIGMVIGCITNSWNTITFF
jgi:rod shape determining protein RodA